MAAKVRRMGGEEPQDGVSELRIAVHRLSFPEVYDTDFYDDFYRWYRDEHPLGDQLYRWVAVTDEGEVVGHLSGFPQYYRINGRRIVAHTPGEYMVLPGYGFQALSLMRAYFRAVENTIATDMVPAVIEVETRLGAEVAGEMNYAAKLLNVSRLPMPAAPARLRRLLGLPALSASGPASGRGYSRGQAGPVEEPPAEEPPQRPRLPFPEPVKAALNYALESLDGALAGRFARGVEVEELEGFDDSFDGLFEKVATVVPCTAERDSGFLGWRYGPGSPWEPVTVLGVRGGQGLLGYAVLKVASAAGQDGFILDLTVLPGHRKAARALLRESVNHFRREGVHIIRYRFVESPTSPDAGDLLRLGFFHRRGRSRKLLTKLADPELHGVASELDNWSYTSGDGEATFTLR